MNSTEFSEMLKEKLKRNKILTIPCKNCQQEVILLKEEGPNGRLVAMNMEMESHWAECSGSRANTKTTPRFEKNFGNENYGKGRKDKRDDFNNDF